MREGSFVPASQLYDVRSQTPIAHPAHQATDEDVRRALEAGEIRADGGHPVSVTGHLIGRNSVPPQGQLVPVPINRISSSGQIRAAYGELQSVQIATIRSAPCAPFILLSRSTTIFGVVPNWLGTLHDRSVETDADRETGGSR